MKRTFLILMVILVAAALIAGCTSQPAQTTNPAAATSAAAQATGTSSPAAPTLTGTEWKLGWYDDTKGVWGSVIQGSTVTARFSPDGTVTGWNGCGEYTTEYKLLQSPGIWFRRPAVPDTTNCQKPTGVDNQISSYYSDLMNSVTYIIVNNQLQTFDKTGKKILQFDPAS